MVELTCGSKRRRSDADENERIALRQMVFNMSICKLQKDIGRKEPSLLRSVLITNTVRYIENEMDEELLSEYNDNNNNYYASEELEPSQVKTSDEIIKNQAELESKDGLLFCDTNSADHQNQNSDVFENKPSKFGIIGDRRKMANDDNANGVCTERPQLIPSGFLLDSLSLPSNKAATSNLDSVELEQNFPDVDIALYDYDNAPLQNLASNEWRIFPTSCAMEFECRKPDAFFEELDQIMQVLVGM